MDPGHEPKGSWWSPRALYITQVVTWTVVFLIFAFSVDLARGSEKPPMCPSVLASLGDQSAGVPFDLIGLGEGLIFIGVMWFLSGVLGAVYTRWPRWFFWWRVAAARITSRSARWTGLGVTAAGAMLLVGVQVGCELTA